MRHCPGQHSLCSLWVTAAAVLLLLSNAGLVGTAAAVLLLPLSNAGLGQCYYKWQSTSSLVRNADWASAIMWQSTSSYREALQMGASALAAIGGTDPSDARGIASKLVLLRMLAC